MKWDKPEYNTRKKDCTKLSRITPKSQCLRLISIGVLTRSGKKYQKEIEVSKQTNLNTSKKGRNMENKARKSEINRWINK